MPPSQLLLGLRETKGREAGRAGTLGMKTAASLHPSLSQIEWTFTQQPGAGNQNLRITVQALLTLFPNKLQNKAMLTIFFAHASQYIPRHPAQLQAHHFTVAKSTRTNSCGLWSVAPAGWVNSSKSFHSLGPCFLKS